MTSMRDFLLAGGLGGHVPTGIPDIDALEDAVYIPPAGSGATQPVAGVVVGAPSQGQPPPPQQQGASGGNGSSGGGGFRGPDLGILGRLLDPGGIFGPGLFGPSGSGGILSGQLPGSGLVGLLGQGIQQALGGGGAGHPLAALMGGGLGGLSGLLAGGTGPLPGILGGAWQNLVGVPRMPALSELAQHLTVPAGEAAPLYRDLATHTERAGRAVVRRIVGATEPQLEAIRRMLEHRRNQIQATTEHRHLMNDEEFKVAVIEHLLRLQQRQGLVPVPGAVPGIVPGTVVATGVPLSVGGVPVQEPYRRY